MKTIIDMTYEGTIGAWVVMKNVDGIYWGLPTKSGFDPVKAESFSKLASAIEAAEKLRDINRRLYSGGA